MIEQTQKLLNSIFGCELQGKVITVIGPAGLGKSTFACMQLPAYIYNEYKREVGVGKECRFIVINTDYSLLTERFSQVLKCFNVNYTDIRDYLRIEYVNSFYKQDELVKAILKECLEDKSIEPLYITIDPFNHLLRQEFAKAKEEYRLNVVGRLSPRLEHQLNILTLLARKTGCTVVLTLLPKKAYTNTVPAKWQNAFFGPTEIAHLSDVVLWFSHNVEDKKGITIHVMKHRLRETPFQVSCKLTDGGIRLI